MNAPKRKEIHDGSERQGDVLSVGIDGMEEPLAALSPLECTKMEAKPAIGSNQISGFQAPLLPEFDERTKEFIRTRVFALTNDPEFRKAMTGLKACREKAIKLASGSKTDGFKTCAELLDLVPIFAALAVVSGGSRKETWGKFWSAGTGKTWKALREYPRRLREMAKEVESINDSPFFSPERSITSKTPLAVHWKRQLLRLPAALRRYAEWLESWAERIPALQEQYSHRSRRGHSPSLGYLSTLAKVMTGRYCDSEVSEVLNAADLVLNPGKPKSGLRFCPQTMADLRARQKKKKATGT
jgi:hypothetical protein